MADEPVPEKLSRLMSGFWHTQLIYVAAKLGLADLVAASPRTADELAKATATHHRALYGLLRALASLGIFDEDVEHRFHLTPMAEHLRSDVPDSQRSIAIMRGEWQYEAWGQLLYTIKTGRSAFEKLRGVPLFEYLTQDENAARIFDAAMTGVHGRETAAMLDAYDFTGINTIVDIGGGNASVLTAVLARYPQMHGILFDLPHVAARARANIEAAGVAGRCRVESGSFFDSVPTVAGAYLLRHIIHDWDDDRCRLILANCRRAMTSSGRLLVVEGVVPPGNEPSLSKLFDVSMMVVPGGMERTADEYSALLAAAGFRLTRIVPTASWISVIEGEPIDQS